MNASDQAQTKQFEDCTFGEEPKRSHFDTALTQFMDHLTLDEATMTRLAEKFGLSFNDVESVAIDCCQSVNDLHTMIQLFDDYKGDEKKGAAWFESYVDTTLEERSDV